MRPYEDPEHEGNSAKYHTGKCCIWCDRPAGTWWSQLWCFEHNVERMNRLDIRLRGICERAGLSRPEEG